jgi:hypothetical protein
VLSLCVFGEGQQAKAEGRLHSVCDNVCVFGVHGDLTSAGYPSHFASGSRCQGLVCGKKLMEVRAVIVCVMGITGDLTSVNIQAYERVEWRRLCGRDGRVCMLMWGAMLWVLFGSSAAA